VVELRLGLRPTPNVARQTYRPRKHYRQNGRETEVVGLRTLVSGALFTAFCVVVTMAASAPADSPQNFVAAIYKTYVGKMALSSPTRQ